VTDRFYGMAKGPDMAEQKNADEKTPLGGVSPGDTEHEHGIPHDSGEQAQPKGTPTSDRHDTETAPKRQ
jgi:hypothetical protein